jgi:hypothetical protein
MKPTIKIRQETTVYPAHYDSSFWDDLAGRKGNFCPERTETRPQYDVVLNNKVVKTYGLMEHAEEYVEELKILVADPSIIPLYEAFLEIYEDAKNDVQAVQDKYPFLIGEYRGYKAALAKAAE